MKTKMTFSNTVAVRRWVLVAPALVAIVLASCTSQSGPDSPVIAALSSPAANALGAFLLIRPDLSPQDVAAVASPLTSVLYSASASQSLLESVSKSVTPEGSVFADVSDVPGLKVAYTRGNSTVLAFNERITRDTASLSDIGAAAAQSIFTSAFQSFLATGAISRTNRVGQGGCPPRPPTDPDVQISRIRLFGSRFRCLTVDAVDHDRRRERIPLQQIFKSWPTHLGSLRSTV